MIIAVPKKRQIQRAFSSKAKFYSAEAIVQRMALDKLAFMLQTVGMEKTPWLDLGCGVGLFESSLDALGVVRDLNCMDLCRESLKILAKENYSPMNLFQGDIDLLPVKESTIGVAVLAAVLQWVEDPLGVLRKIQKILVPGGILAFSIFVEGSFREIFDLRAQKGMTIPARLPALEQARQIISSNGFEIIGSESFFEKVHFASAYEALKSLSRMGATAVSGNRMTPGELKQFCDNYEKKVRTDIGIPLTHHVFLGLAKKV